jgi:hypothetical protein
MSSRALTLFLFRYPTCSVIFVVSCKTARIQVGGLMTGIWLEHRKTNFVLEDLITLERRFGITFLERLQNL